MSRLQALDVSLFRFVNDTLSNPLFDRVMPWLSGNGLFIPALLVFLGLVAWRGRTKGAVFCLLLALAIGVTDGLVCNKLKYATDRARPCVALEDVNLRVGCSESGSLPSSHAGNWFAAVSVAWLFQRRSWRVLLPLALGVSFSRVYNGVHYPGDVLAGAILGAGSGLATVFAADAIWRGLGRRCFPLWYERLPSLIPSPSVDFVRPAGPELETRREELDRHWLRAGYVLILVLTLARWGYVGSRVIELSEDEAYQWVWSKHLALSYYSKPPLIACTQWLGTTLWGDNAFGVRFFSPLIAAILGCLMLRFFAREISARTGFFLVLILTATPLLSVGSTLLTVDPLAVLFWTAAMLSGWRAVQPNSPTSAWLWTGLWMGLGFLSKYTSPLQWLCWVVFFALWPAARMHLRRPGPYLALLINLLCTLPVLVWNWQHDWVTVKHVAAHGGAGKEWSPTLKYFFEFIGAEFFLLNPWFFVAAMIALAALWRMPRRDARLVYLFSMGSPVFLLYTLLSLKSRVHPNWIAPAVLPVLCVMVIYWESRFREQPRLIKTWLTFGLIFGLTAGVLIHDTNLAGKMVGRSLPVQIDPLRRVRGHREMAGIVGQVRDTLAREGKPVFIIGDHYGITSLLTFYLPDARKQVLDAPVVFCQPSDHPVNQYYFWPGYAEAHIGQNALYVRERQTAKLASGWILRWLKGETALTNPATLAVPEPAPGWLARQFDSVTNRGLFDVRIRGRLLRKVEIFECRTLR